MPLPVPMPLQASDNIKVTVQMCDSLAPGVDVTLCVSKGKTCFKFMMNIKAKLILIYTMKYYNSISYQNSKYLLTWMQANIPISENSEDEKIKT